VSHFAIREVEHIAAPSAKIYEVVDLLDVERA
jgi:hypothetical protein